MQPTGEIEAWKRLGRAIVNERSRRWRTRADFAAAIGVSARVLDDLENGNRANYSFTTYAAVESALGWEPGSCAVVLMGHQPRRQMDPEMRRLTDIWPHLSKDARALIVEMAERARQRD